MTQRETLERLRIMFVASEILFFLNAFRTKDYDRAVMGCETQCREQLLERLCDVLIERTDDYHRMIDHLKKCTNGVNSYLGIKSMKYLNAELCASNLLYDIESLERPLIINDPSTLSEDF